MGSGTDISDWSCKSRNYLMDSRTGRSWSNYKAMLAVAMQWVAALILVTAVAKAGFATDKKQQYW